MTVPDIPPLALADGRFPGRWKHNHGGVYYIKGFAIDENNMWPVVIYEKWDGQTGQIWTRPCHEFFDGRFKKLPDTDK